MPTLVYDGHVPSPAAPTPYHRGNLRRELLALAEQALQTSGTDGISLRQLAREAGVSHSAPSKHFHDKRALLDALAIEGFTRLGTSFEALQKDPNFFNRLFAIGRCYMQFASSNPALATLMFARKHGPGADSQIAEKALQSFNIPISVIKQGQAQGEIVSGDPIQIGISLLATLHGIATFISSGFVAEQEADTLLSATLNHLNQGLRPRHDIKS